MNQLKDRFGQSQLRRFDTRIVEGYQSERLEAGNKPATVNRHIATLKHMFTKAVDVLDQTLTLFPTSQKLRKKEGAANV